MCRLAERSFGSWIAVRARLLVMLLLRASRRMAPVAPCTSHAPRVGPVTSFVDRSIDATWIGRWIIDRADRRLVMPSAPLSPRLVPCHTMDKVDAGAPPEPVI